VIDPLAKARLISKTGFDALSVRKGFAPCERGEEFLALWLPRAHGTTRTTVGVLRSKTRSGNAVGENRQVG